MSRYQGLKFKNLLTVFLICGAFLFVSQANALNNYAKEYNGTLTAAEWNGLFSDFVNTMLPVRMNGPLGINTAAPTNPIFLDVNGTVQASAFLGPITGTISAANVSSGAFGGNTGGGNYSFPGNVGIGTTAPAYKLDVQGTTAQMQIKSTTATNYALFKINNGGGDLYFGREQSTGGGLATGSTGYAGVINAQGTYPLQFAVNNAIGVTILNGGNVGIGITNPTTKFHVSGTMAGGDPFYAAHFSNLLSYGAGTGLGPVRITLGRNSTVHGYIEAGSSSDNDSSNGYMAFGTRRPVNSITEAMRIDRYGNIGIGTTAPNDKLSVKQASNYGYANTINNALAVYADNSAFKKIYFGFDTSLGSYGSGYIQAEYQGAARLPLLLNANGGNVGIGTTTPATTLDVNGLIKMRTSTIISSEDVVNKGYLDSALASTTSGIITQVATSSFWQGSLTGSIYNANTGNVGIGTTTPSQKLSVNGNMIFSGSSGRLYFPQTPTTFNWIGDGIEQTGVIIDPTNDGTSERISFVTNNAERLRINAAGNVGIGTTNPQYNLHVSGTQYFGGTQYRYAPTIESQGNNIKVLRNLASLDSGDPGNVGAIVIDTGIPFTDYSMMNMRISGYIDRTPGGAFELSLGGYAYVGPNFINPQIVNMSGVRFSVVRAYQNTTTGNLSIVLGDVTDTFWKPKVYVNEVLIGHGSTAQNFSSGWSISKKASLSGYNLLNTFVNSTVINTITDAYFGSNVGIGTIAPNDKFSIGLGGAAAPAGSDSTGHNYTNTYLSTDDYALTNYGLVKTLIAGGSGSSVGYWTMSGANIYNSNSGNVGIGTTNPTAKLYINSGGGSNSGVVIRSDGSTGGYASLDYVNKNNVRLQTGLYDSGDAFFYMSSAGNKIGFYTNDLQRMTIAKDGNVGIGTTNPVQRLEVGGNVLFNNSALNVYLRGNSVGDPAISFSRFPGSDLTLGAKIQYVMRSASVQESGALAFWTNPNTVAGTDLTERMRIDSAGNVGIGTTNPINKLTIGTTVDNSTTSSANISFVYTPSINFINSITNVFSSSPGVHSMNFNTMYSGIAKTPLSLLGNGNAIFNAGNVGIGTTAPNDKLSIGLGGSAAPAGSDSTGHNYTNTYLSTDDYALTNYGLVKTLIAGGSGSSVGYWTMSGANIYNSNSGNVGIGTTTPAAKLHINGGTGSLSTGLAFGDGDTGVNELIDDILDFKTNSITSFYTSSGSTQSGNGSGWQLTNSAPTSILPTLVPNRSDTDTGIGWTSANILSLIAGGVNGLNINSSGNVGIGKINPATALDVNGTVTALAFSGPLSGTISSQNVSAGEFGKNTGGGNFIFGATVAGNVGIGLTSPGYKTEIQRIETVNRTTYNDILAVTANATTNPWSGHGGGIVFRGTTYRSGSGNVNYARIGSTLNDHSASTAGSDLFFDVSPLDDGVLSRAMTIKYNGNIGIGTTDPGAYKLKVAGDVAITGALLTQTGSDFAEEFKAPHSLEAGTVVVMGDEGYKSVKACVKGYDKTVVGIVSDNPSIIAGRTDIDNKNPEKVIVAMMGVVSVNVSDINGSIEKGDLLVSSGISGYAMKSIINRPGTVIGKALENLTGKTGKIKVLVNLQ